MQLIYCQSKKLSSQSLFTLLFVQLRNIYFFRNLFSFLSIYVLGPHIWYWGQVLLSKCLAVKLYFMYLILHDFQYYFSKSILQYQLLVTFYEMWSFYDSILNISCILPNQYSCQLISDKPNNFEFFSCCKVSNILHM